MQNVVESTTEHTTLYEKTRLFLRERFAAVYLHQLKRSNKDKEVAV
jgi:hypothetical protein